jgi:hypothetical protein
MRTATLFAPALLAAALAGCTALAPDGPAPEVYAASLAGSQEVPPTASAATGEAEVRFDPRTRMAQWRVRYAGLSGPVTGAHVHGPAGPERNAGIQLPLGNPATAAQVLEGRALLTPQQANELSSGLWYVNIHTAAHPAGEIRGQLRIRR